MKRITAFIRTLACCALSALLLPGCGGDEGLNPGTSEGTRGLTVTFSVNNEAKTATGSMADIVYPTGPDSEGLYIGEQHTTDVFLYIFQGTGSDATCVAYEDVGWSEHFSSKLPVTTEDSQMPYEIKYKDFLYNVRYTLLAVGLSKGADEVYGFPGAIGGKESTTWEGITLGEAKAELAAEQTCDGINTSEIYVGTAEFTPLSGKEVKVNLWRRVAGVAGYFKNVPRSIGEKDVAALRIALYDKQYTALPLLEREQAPVFKDYIDSRTKDEDGNVLVYIPVTEFGIDKKVSGGAYVLPAPAPSGAVDWTLRIELVDATGKVLDSRRAKLPEGDGLDPGITGGGTGIIDTESAYRFPIVANHFYALGNPDNPIDLQGQGLDILITIDPTWREEVDLGVSESTN